MRHLIESIRRSVQQQNWYAALNGALAIPDIAGKVDGLMNGSAKRYVAWFNQYLLPTYTSTNGNEPTVFLSGEDCYALRCAYLHEGDFDISEQRIRNALDRFRFVAQSSGMIEHCNICYNPTIPITVLQLQVSFFCEDFCSAVEQWLTTKENDPCVAAALAKLPLIEIGTRQAEDPS